MNKTPGPARRDGYLLELALTGVFGGAVVGLMELAIGLRPAPWPGLQTVLVAFGLSASLLALYGLIVAVTISLMAKAVCSKKPFHLKIGVIFLGAVLVAVRYEFSQTLALVVCATLIVWIVWRLGSRPALMAFILWCLLFLALKPFFSGLAMELVFTDWQVLFIMVAAMAGTYLLFFALAIGWMEEPLTGFPAFVSVLLALVAGLALAVASSLFLIRLWGFNTMGYLQFVVLTLWIGIIGPPVRMLVVARFREASSILLLSLVAVIAFVSLASKDSVNLVTKRAPNGGAAVSLMAMTFDFDRDGYSSLFGFGDCDDNNSNINPGAIDWPKNGVDENCIGGDLQTLKHNYFTLPVDVIKPPREKGRKGKVVVFVVVDTLRADMVSTEQAPVLSAIGKESLRFSNAYAQANNTLESTPYFFQIGFRNLPLFNSNWMLVKALRAGGVKSAGVFQASVKEWWGAAGFGGKAFDFDVIHRPDESVRNFTLTQVSEKAVETLSGYKEGEDLFLFVHFEALHDSFTQVMEGERITGEGLNISEVARMWDIDGVVSAMRRRYLDVLAGIDKAMAPLVGKVHELKDKADLLFIISSDHGEEFYEHGGLFHMGALYDETTKVPLFISGTGIEPGEESTPVGLYRIPDTILDFFGFEGRRVTALDLLNRPVGDYEVFSHFSWRDKQNRRVYMLVDKGFKLIVNLAEGKREFYNLTDDPAEQNNLSGDPKVTEVENRLLEKIDSTLFYMNYGDYTLANMRKRK